jgi:hypothetical protein
MAMEIRRVQAKREERKPATATTTTTTTTTQKEGPIPNPKQNPKRNPKRKRNERGAATTKNEAPPATGP